jgi:hypothetical protein
VSQRNRRQPRRLFLNQFQLKLAVASVVCLCAGTALIGALSPGVTARALLALLLAVTSLGFISLSHRVAGPLVRFQNVFYALRRCDLSDRVRLRESDWLHDEADDLNAAVRHLRRRVAVLRARHLAAEVALGKVRIAVDSKNPTDLMRAIRSLDRAHARIAANLARFTIQRGSQRGTAAPVSNDEAWWRARAG